MVVFIVRTTKINWIHRFCQFTSYTTFDHNPPLFTGIINWCQTAFPDLFGSMSELMQDLTVLSINLPKFLTIFWQAWLFALIAPALLSRFVPTENAGVKKSVEVAVTLTALALLFLQISTRWVFSPAYPAPVYALIWISIASISAYIVHSSLILLTGKMDLVLVENLLYFCFYHRDD